MGAGWNVSKQAFKKQFFQDLPRLRRETAGRSSFRPISLPGLLGGDFLFMAD